MSSPRIIGHLDMDAFFAAIEERDTPRFRGLPIVVGADPRGGHGRGVVSTASYAARAYGIHSAQPISEAWRLSEAARRQGRPAALFLEGDFRKYEASSERIMAILRQRVPLVQQRSVDEAYFDLTFLGSTANARSLCQQLKDEIRARERLTASVGIGPNKLIAKIASDFKKPDGLVLVEDYDAAAFLAPLPIRVIPGIGPKTEALLRAKGITCVRDARRLPAAAWTALLGKWGVNLYQSIWARDDTPVHESHIAKSVGAHSTFVKDTLDPLPIGEELVALCARVMRRLTEEGFESFRTVILTVRFADFQTVSRAHTSRRALGTSTVLCQEALRLLLPFLDRRENPRRRQLRMIGVRVERLAGADPAPRPVDDKRRILLPYPTHMEEVRPQ